MENMLLLSFLYHQSVSDRCSRLEKNRNFEICSWLHSPFYCKMKLKAFGVLLDLMNLKQNNLKINGKILQFFDVVNVKNCDLLREKEPTAVKRRFKTQLTSFSL